MRQRAASGGVTAGIWVLKRPRKPPRPPTKGRAEQLCGAKLRRAPSGGGRLYMREFSTNAETGQQKRPLLSSCSCRSKADVAAFNLPISFRRQQNTAVRGILLPSHPRRTFCPLALVRARQAPAFQADAGSAARKAAMRLCAALPACPSAASPLTPAILRIAGAHPYP